MGSGIESRSNVTLKSKLSQFTTRLAELQSFGVGLFRHNKAVYREDCHVAKGQNFALWFLR